MRHLQACSGNKFARLVAAARVVLYPVYPSHRTHFIYFFPHSLYTFSLPFLFSSHSFFPPILI